MQKSLKSHFNSYKIAQKYQSKITTTHVRQPRHFSYLLKPIFRRLALLNLQEYHLLQVVRHQLFHREHLP